MIHEAIVICGKCGWGGKAGVYHAIYGARAQVLFSCVACAAQFLCIGLKAGKRAHEKKLRGTAKAGA